MFIGGGILIKCEEKNIYGKRAFFIKKKELSCFFKRKNFLNWKKNLKIWYLNLESGGEGERGGVRGGRKNKKKKRKPRQAAHNDYEAMSAPTVVEDFFSDTTGERRH